MSYVDGYVLAIPKKNMKAYKKMALMAAKVWLKHGAVEYKECVAEDLKTSWGTTFTKMMKQKPNETVVFAYIEFKSRKHRDVVNAKVMKDPAMMPEQYKDKPMPFDCKRMVYGGFKVIVGA